MTNGHADVPAPSRFEYDPGVIRYGRGCVDALADELAAQGAERALVVCGETVGNTPAVVDPVREGLGERLADVFAETTPEKRLETALAGAEAMREADADAIVSLGGGSSLDVAKAVSLVAASDRSREEIVAEFAERGTISTPDAPLPPILAVPTTLAGADLSQIAGLNATPEGPVGETVSGGLSDPALMPAALHYDPDLFATTPMEVLAGSAMNGFDKGIEALYVPTATPVTDATASRGLSLLRDGLPALARDPEDEAAMEGVVAGVMLVQYGISPPDESMLSLIHAFGHGVTDHVDVQQGVVHAVLAPHVLDYVFEHVDGRRHLLADALGVDATDDDEAAAGVVEAVADVRDALGLPDRLRDVEDFDRAQLDAVAQSTFEDSLTENAPPGLEPTVADLRDVLEAAW